MNNINFKASYVDKINVLKKDNTNKYCQYSANIVKLGKSDLNALKEINKIWDKNSFCKLFVDWAQEDHKKNNELYAVTTQEKGFDKLSADNVIGLINFALKKRSGQIYYLETKSANNNDNNEFDKIGTSLVNYIKTKTNRITLFALTPSLIENFYKQLGFINRYTDKTNGSEYGELIWIKNPTKFDKMQIKLQKQYNDFTDKLKSLFSKKN